MRASLLANAHYPNTPTLIAASITRLKMSAPHHQTAPTQRDARAFPSRREDASALAVISPCRSSIISARSCGAQGRLGAFKVIAVARRPGTRLLRLRLHLRGRVACVG